MPKHDDMVGSWHWMYQGEQGAKTVAALCREDKREATIVVRDEELLDLICTLLNENELPPRTVEATVKDEAGGVKREYTVRDVGEMMSAIGIKRKNKRAEGEDL